MSFIQTLAAVVAETLATLARAQQSPGLRGS